MTTFEKLAAQHRRVRRLRDEIKALTEEYVLELARERELTARLIEEQDAQRGLVLL